MISTPTFCAKSSSISRSSSAPSRNCLRSFWRVSASRGVGGGVRLVREADGLAARQQRIEDAILGAILGLRAHALDFACSRVSLYATSARSRTICSTSLPT